MGQIKPLPAKTENHLTWSNHAKGSSKAMQSGMVLILCGGQKRVITLGSDLAYEEKKITKIRFDRIGEVGFMETFKKRHYQTRLKKEIIEQIQTFDFDPELPNSTKVVEKFSLSQAEKVANTMKFQDEVLCNNNGDIYRIASIFDRNFNEDIACDVPLPGFDIWNDSDDSDEEANL